MNRPIPLRAVRVLHSLRSHLWTSLENAQVRAINGEWSMDCDNLVDYIRDVEALIGRIRRDDLPPAVISVWERLGRGEPPHYQGYEALQLRRLAQAKAAGIPEGEAWVLDEHGRMSPAKDWLAGASPWG